MLGDTVNAREVRILLDCSLVENGIHGFYYQYLSLQLSDQIIILTFVLITIFTADIYNTEQKRRISPMLVVLLLIFFGFYFCFCSVLTLEMAHIDLYLYSPHQVAASKDTNTDGQCGQGLRVKIAFGSPTPCSIISARNKSKGLFTPSETSKNQRK